MSDDAIRKVLRQDCLASLKLQPTLATQLTEQRIAVVGGTGFIGTWIAEIVAALNDELGARVRLDLLGRSAVEWAAAHPHFAARDDIHLKSVDVRSMFELEHDTTLVLFAAGVANPRVHASDPFRVHETALHGVANALAASERLELLQRFVNLSSGLVLGAQTHDRALKESDIGTLDFTRVHNIYAESRRAAESLVSIYASQYRIPVSTARAFTFLGPYQPFDAPWAANNFIQDALLGNDIRIHGDGSARRSYLYGSDAGIWLLKILLDGEDGEVYNVGGDYRLSHAAVAELVASLMVIPPKVVYKTKEITNARQHDFFPDMGNVKSRLDLAQAFGVEDAIKRTMRWHARRLGVMRLLREESQN